MTAFQQPFWGYTFQIPAELIHRRLMDADGFAMIPAALAPDYEGPNLGHIVVRGEWNWQRQPLEPVWNRHMTRLSIMLGAKRVGSAAWTMGGATGLEAEIQLPQKVDKRLWVGILSSGPVILHFMVTHRKEERQTFEPLATRLISSLSVIKSTKDIQLLENGLPIPPGYSPINPKLILPDITDSQPWQAFAGSANPGALQAFYTREAPALGWKLIEYVPYPAPGGLGFARYKLQKNGQTFTLGIFPFGENDAEGRIVIKTEQ